MHLKRSSQSGGVEMVTMEVTEHEKMILYGLRSMIAENNNEQLKVLEDTYFAKSKQTQFTTGELAAKWECSVKHVKDVLKSGGVKAIGKRGRENNYDGTEAQTAKDDHDSKAIYRQLLTNKLRAM